MSLVVVPEKEELTRAVLVPSNPRDRIQSSSRRKTKIDKKARSWVYQNITIKDTANEECNEIPTNGFGEIDFKGATRIAKAKFVRLSDSTHPSIIFNLLTKQWHLEAPRLVISVSGGAKSFSLDPRLKQVFQAGLLKVAQTPGAWVVTGGTNTGVMQLVGEALQGATEACIGISTYGIVTNRDRLLASDFDDLGGKFPYQVSCSLLEKGAYLDHNHTHHLLVDDGSEEKYGREIRFRSLFEKYVMDRGVPAVLLVLQGGVGTIQTIWSAISEDNPISIVIIKDSGKAADVFADAMNLMSDCDEDYLDSDSCKSEILEMMNRSFPVLGEEEKRKCCDLIIFCLRKKELFTVFQMSGESAIDEAILMALLNGHEASPMEQLKLTLMWDRVELAKEKVLSQPCHWKQNELDDVMIMSLAMDRVDFIRLFLNYGVSIETLLTNEVLEFLYGYLSHTTSSTLNYEFDAKEYCAAQMDQHGEVITTLCSFAGLNPRNCSIPRSTIQQVIRVLCKNLLVKGGEEFIEDPDPSGWFEFPYRELFIWAVLNNMQRMAMYLWEFEEEGISKALIAAEINTVLNEHAQKLDLQDYLVKSFAGSASEFKVLALNMLDECYRMDEMKTIQLITCEFSQFTNQTSLNLAVNTKDMNFVSHNAVQFLLNEVWTGCIKMREVSDLYLFAAFLFPPLISNLSFYTESAMKSRTYLNSDGFDRDDDDEGDKDGVSVRSYQNGGSVAFRTKSSTKLVPNGVKYGNYESVSRQREKEKETQMPYYKKFCMFYYKTPIIKFYANVAAYFTFLFLFAYVCLLKKEKKMYIPEYVLIVYVVALTVAEMYQITLIDSSSIIVKVKEWMKSNWNKLDAIAIILFFTALGFRLNEATIDIGHLVLAIDGGFWVMRLLHVFFVHRILGPYVVMLVRMTRDLLYFMVIMSVFLFSYGVTSKSILDPQPPHVGVDKLLRNIIFHPYFNIYGELFTDRDPENNATTRFGTPVVSSYAEPIAWILLGIYLLITNILLVNILIAIFNNTFNDVQEKADQIWKFERHGLVIEYAQRAPLVAPFNLVVHLYLIIPWLLQKCGICDKKRDDAYNGSLKSDVSSEVKEELIEFENRCVAAFVRKKELMLTKSVEEASVDILLQVENMNTTMNHLNERLKDMESQMKKFNLS